MKEKDFDFNRVGKRMPYQMDEQSLDRVTRKLLERCKEEGVSRNSRYGELKPRKLYWRYIYGAVAAILLFFVYLGVHRLTSVESAKIEASMVDSVKLVSKDTDRYAENLSDRVMTRKDSQATMNKITELKDTRHGNAEPERKMDGEGKMPTDRLMDELSDEDLLFLTEITGGTVADERYN